MFDKKQIEINGKTYQVNKFNEEELNLVNQMKDLESKIQKSKFNLTQLEGGRKYFYDKLSKSLIINKP